MTVRDAQERFGEWTRLAACARVALGGSCDLAYGPHARERLDVFRPRTSRGTLLFLHGGYWRAFSKDDFSWIAEPYVQAGITVVIPSYPLGPYARLAEIAASVARAVEYCARVALERTERRRLVIAGHSAGAHLAACCLAGVPPAARTPWMPGAIVCVSGIFDLVPLLHAQFLNGMYWDASELHAMSPLYAPPPSEARIVLAVGETESHELHRQSERLAEAWHVSSPNRLTLAARDHFSAVAALCDPNAPLMREVLALFV